MSGARMTIETLVTAMRLEARGVVSVELRRTDGEPLPPFTAGAHIDIELPDDLLRSYSLVNAPHETHRYVIAIHRAPVSRGGSNYIHDTLRVGHLVRIGAPRNDFALAESAPLSVLLAGGIGITPLWCMIQRLEALEKPWQLYYATRSRDDAAYRGELELLEARRPGRVHFHFDDEHAHAVLDLNGAVERTPSDAHLYCCGPAPMLRAFEEATRGRPRQQVHLEYFSNQVTHDATDNGFTVVLARSGKRVQVTPGVTILDALLEAKVDVSYSCREGVCGTCEVRVLSGHPDHRDLLLGDEEKTANQSIMICCSRSLDDELVLDL